MAKEGKRLRSIREKVEAEKVYSLEEACALVPEMRSTKFDESVDVALRLGVDPRKADQNIRGSVALPHGLGKEVRVAVFARGEKATEAEEAGADIVGAEDLMEKIQGGFLDFDSVVASPDMMALVGRLGKMLGPRGLMPSPKVGTVTPNVGEAVKSVKAGRAEFRVEKTGIVHTPIGRASFSADQIRENLSTLVQEIMRLKPSTSKGVYVKSATLSLTMGPGVQFDTGSVK